MGAAVRIAKYVFVGLMAATAGIVGAQPVAHAGFTTTKSSACAQFDRADVNIGSHFSINQTEFYEGEIVVFTSLSGDGSFVLLTITSPSNQVSTDQDVIGGVVQLAIAETGVNTIEFDLLDAQQAKIPDSSQHVQMACFAAPDRDADSVYDAGDNCPDVANADQADIDQNSVGDACQASGLPTTGWSSTLWAASAAVLVLAGGGATLASRRRAT
jgi:hypothetical protein